MNNYISHILVSITVLDYIEILWFCRFSFLAAILDLAAILNTCWCLNDVIWIFILLQVYNNQLGPIWMQNNWKYSTSFIWRPSWFWRPFWILSGDFSSCIRVRLNSPSFEILKYQVSYFWHQNYAGCIIFKNKSCLRRIVVTPFQVEGI